MTTSHIFILWGCLEKSFVIWFPESCKYLGWQEKKDAKPFENYQTKRENQNF